MNSGFFTGRMAKAPVLKGDKTKVCYFTLIRNEYAGADKPERKVAIPFTAFSGKAEALAKHAMVGDQIQVQYRLQNNDRETDGGIEYGFSFIVDEFEFGAPSEAKREKLAQSQG
jgi:single-strand DNA-binding protein